MMMKAYYRLTKPGIIYGNVMTAAAGFLLASAGDIDWLRLLAVLVGTALVIGSACTFNNYIDRNIDAKMARTQKRALVQGAISSRNALLFGTILGLAGFAILALYTNALAVAIGVVGFVDYVLLYTWSKRHTVHATLIGSVSGATSIAAGYVAALGMFDAGALLVFLAMVVWQMPHFYAIAIFRRDEYAAAGVPVLSIVRGVRAAQLHIVLYIVAFAATVFALTLSGTTGYTFVVAMTILNGVWLWRGVQGLSAKDAVQWARKMFGFSLLVLLALSVLLAMNWLLP